MTPCLAGMRTGFFKKKGIPQSCQKRGNPLYPLQNATDLNILGQAFNNLFQQILVKKEEILLKEEDSNSRGEAVF